MRRQVAWVGSLPVPVRPQRAWDLFSRVEDWGRWDWVGSAGARWVDGPEWRVGSVLRVGHRPVTFDCMITVCDPPRQVEWRGSGLGFHGRHSFAFRPHARGCLVETRETFTGPGAPLIRPLIRWHWRRQLRAFREWCVLCR